MSIVSHDVSAPSSFLHCLLHFLLRLASSRCHFAFPGRAVFQRPSICVIPSTRCSARGSKKRNFCVATQNISVISPSSTLLPPTQLEYLPCPPLMPETTQVELLRLWRGADTTTEPRELTTRYERSIWRSLSIDTRVTAQQAIAQLLVPLPTATAHVLSSQRINCM